MIGVNEVITPNQNRFTELVENALRSGKVTNNGPLVQSFETALQDALQLNHILTVSSGTLALQIAFRAMESKGEVIVSPFSCIASVSSLVWEGYTPVFCDVDSSTWCIDPNKVVELITDKTVGISGVHVFGNPCDIRALEDIAKKHSLFTVYDGAQAFGSTYDNRSCLSFGTVSTVSLHAYKIVSSIEGGAVICNDPVLNEKLYETRYFGKNRFGEEVRVGTNAKMSEVHAAYGLLSLENYKNEQFERDRIAQFYRSEFGSNSQLQLQQPYRKSKSNNSYFAVVFPTAGIKQRVVAAGINNGVEFREYFYPSLSTFEFLGANQADTPIADCLATRVLCLPIHSRLTKADLNLIVACVKVGLDEG